MAPKRFMFMLDVMAEDRDDAVYLMTNYVAPVTTDEAKIDNIAIIDGVNPVQIYPAMPRQ